MSDRFRKAFRRLLVCGRFNPAARQSAAAANMAATMATEVRSEMCSIRHNPHPICYNNSAGSSHSRGGGKSNNTSSTGNITAFAMVEMQPKQDHTAAGSNSNKQDLLSPPSSDICQKHKHIKRYIYVLRQTQD